MKITLSDEQRAVEWTREMQDAVERALREAADGEGIDFYASVLLTDDTGICKLNAEFRGIDKETDVLSFPAYSLEKPLAQCIGEVDTELEDGLVFVGDIAISMERAQAQAMEYGHSILREIAFLALHGALHLLGYDHENAGDETVMLRKQNEYLEGANINR